MFFDRFWRLPLYSSLFVAIIFCGITRAESPAGVVAEHGKLDVHAWLRKLNESAQRKSYTGTFVVSTAGSMSAARIWHVCDGTQQVERVDTLTGPARNTLRRNEEVVTFLPDERLALLERRDSLSLFPAVLQAGNRPVGDFYTLRPILVNDRVAGLAAEAHELVPKDDWRYGYRVWSERKTGLVLKLQTLDANRQVLEQVAFSDLNLDAPVKADQLLRMMNNRSGYRVQRLVQVQTSPQEQGWRVRQSLPGFVSSGCQVRGPAGVADPSKVPMQCVFTDGLASISAFVEPYDEARHISPGQMSSGATQSMSKRVGDFWLTLVGEVPAKTLAWYAHALERTR